MLKGHASHHSALVHADTKSLKSQQHHADTGLSADWWELRRNFHYYPLGIPAPYSTMRKGWWLEWSWVVGTDAAGEGGSGPLLSSGGTSRKNYDGHYGS